MNIREYFFYKTIPCNITDYHNFSSCYYYHTSDDKRRIIYDFSLDLTLIFTNVYKSILKTTKLPFYINKLSFNDDFLNSLLFQTDYCKNQIEYNFHIINFKAKKCILDSNGLNCNKGNFCCFIHKYENLSFLFELRNTYSKLEKLFIQLFEFKISKHRVDVIETKFNKELIIEELKVLSMRLLDLIVSNDKINEYDEQNNNYINLNLKDLLENQIKSYCSIKNKNKFILLRKTNDQEVTEFLQKINYNIMIDITALSEESDILCNHLDIEYKENIYNEDTEDYNNENLIPFKDYSLKLDIIKKAKSVTDKSGIIFKENVHEQLKQLTTIKSGVNMELLLNLANCVIFSSEENQKLEELNKIILSLINSSNGYILIGVDEFLNAKGLLLGRKERDVIKQQLNVYFKNFIVENSNCIKFKFLDIENKEKDDICVFVIKVKKINEEAFNYDNKQLCYILREEVLINKNKNKFVRINKNSIKKLDTKEFIQAYKEKIILYYKTKYNQ